MLNDYDAAEKYLDTAKANEESLQASRYEVEKRLAQFGRGKHG